MSSTSSTQQTATIPKPIRFLFGGGSGYDTINWNNNYNKWNEWYIRMAATCFVQPLDLIKNRMQLSGMSIAFIVSSIVKFNEM